MNWNDRVKESIIARHLNPEYLGEQVEIQEPGKPMRTIYVHIEEDEDVRVDVETGQVTRIDLADTLVLRDENELTRGGVSTPIIGTWMRRAAAVDSNRRRYYFNGDIKHRTVVKMHMVFERLKMLADSPGA